MLYKKNYGWVPDIPDKRDYLYSAIKPVIRLPRKVDIRQGCSEIEDQLALGSCTAQALAGSIEFLDKKIDGLYTDISRLFIYYNERAIEGSVEYELLAIIVVGGIISFAVGGLLVMRRLVHHTKLRPHHEVADPILGVVGAIYAVLLAFVVISVWQEFDKSNANVETEANYLADIYRDAEAFQPEFRQNISVLLREYRTAVIDDEWQAMEKGRMSANVERLMRKIWTAYTLYQPRNATEQVFFDESVRKLNLFRELRRQRIMDSRSGINPLLWFVLLIGGLGTISFTFLFGTENVHAHIAMVILLSLTIGLILFTIMELDFPFTGSVSISPEPFKEILLD